jgi:hypothetical protein
MRRQLARRQISYTHSFVNEFRRYLVAFLFFFSGCVNIPDSYAPPVQRRPLTGTEPSDVGHFVNLGDRNADAYIVRDVTESAEGGTWRWTRKHPELRFFLDSIDHLTYAMDFSIAETTLKDTGPVTLTISINGNLLDTLHHDTPGERHYKKPVPAKFLRLKTVNHVSMEIDPVWVSKTDGAILGFILTRAGFTQ